MTPIKHKEMDPESLARILGAKITGDEPDIILHVITSESGQLLVDGPYERVDVNLILGVVTIVKRSSIFWERIAAIIDRIFRRRGR